MPRKLRFGFTGIEILVLGALIVSLITGTIATSDTAKKFLLKPKASTCSGVWTVSCPDGFVNTADCDIQNMFISVWKDKAEETWKTDSCVNHQAQPQPVPEKSAGCTGIPCSGDFCDNGARFEGDVCDTVHSSCTQRAEDYCKSISSTYKSSTSTTTDKSNICETNGLSCSGITVGQRCSGGVNATCQKTGTVNNGYAKCSCVCPVGMKANEKGDCVPKTTSTGDQATITPPSGNCMGKPKPDCDSAIEEVVCVGGRWICELLESKPKTICSPNTFSNCVDNDTRKMMCNSTGTGYTYETCPAGQKCDYANKKCSTDSTGPQTTTETLPTCEIATKPDQYCSEFNCSVSGVETASGSCPPSKNFCCKRKTTNVSSGTKILSDGTWCGTDNQSGETSCLQKCKSSAHYTKGSSLYCGTAPASGTTTGTASTDGQTPPTTYKIGDICYSTSICESKCPDKKYYFSFTDSVWKCGTSTSSTSSQPQNTCQVSSKPNQYCTTNAQCRGDGGTQGTGDCGDSSYCCLSKSSTAGTTVPLSLSYGQECNPGPTATNSCLKCPDPQNTPTIIVDEKQTTICGTPKNAEKLYCLNAGEYTCSSDNNSEILCINPKVPTVSTICPNGCDTDTGQCKKTAPVTPTYEACVTSCNESLNCVTTKCSQLLTSGGEPIGESCYLNFPLFNCSSCPNGSIYIGKVSDFVGAYKCLSGKPSLTTPKKETPSSQAPTTPITPPVSQPDQGQEIDLSLYTCDSDNGLAKLNGQTQFRVVCCTGKTPNLGSCPSSETTPILPPETTPSTTSKIDWGKIVDSCKKIPLLNLACGLLPGRVK